MAKTSLDEKWRYCSRCGFRQAYSNLRRDPETGSYYCTVQAVCLDEPDRDDLRRVYRIKGRAFDR